MSPPPYIHNIHIYIHNSHIYSVKLIQFTLGGFFSPSAEAGSTKYGSSGLYTTHSFDNLNINSSMKTTLVVAANSALTQNTHSTYKTAERMWELCAQDTGITGQFPVTKDEVLVYTAWLLKRGLCAATINSYLSGIRTAHLTKGLVPPQFRSDIINTVLRGQSHLDSIERRLGTRRTRLPVTPDVLRLMRAELSNSNLKNADKLLLWSCCTLLFFGGFRCHELLSLFVTKFDPAFTLLSEDITENTVRVNGSQIRTLQILIKSEKKDTKGESTVVDIYESTSDICPIAAYQGYKKVAANERGKPAFRLSDGKPLTGRKLNEYIKFFLGKHLDTDSKFVSSHSFRSGLASMLGSLGFSEDQIKDAGRWSSEAYQRYLKLPRTRRFAMAKQLCNLHF